EKTRAIIKSQAQAWVEWEFENRKNHPALKPIAVEVPLEFQLTSNLKLVGRADRVDSDGENAVVIDYKSGNADFIGKELLAGIGAQLLMYLKAVEHSYKLHPAGAFYLSVKRTTKMEGGVFLKEH